jgi:hypothetical protein
MLTKSHAWAAAILVDELDTCFLESRLNFLSSCLPTAEQAFHGF